MIGREWSRDLDTGLWLAETEGDGGKIADINYWFLRVWYPGSNVRDIGNDVMIQVHPYILEESRSHIF